VPQLTQLTSIYNLCPATATLSAQKLCHLMIVVLTLLEVIIHWATTTHQVLEEYNSLPQN